MRRLLLCGVVLVALAATGLRDASGQNLDETEVISVGFVIGESDSIPAPPVRWVRFYAEPPQLRFGFSVANRSESKVPLLIDTEGIRHSVAVVIERETEVPVMVRWLDEITLDFDPMRVPPGSTWVRLDPGHQLGWTIVAERADGRVFDVGRYVLTAVFRDVRNAVRTIDGTTWRGRVPEGTAQWTLLVQPPTSAAERARMHALAASAALARGDTERALSEYLRQLEADPANVSAQIAIGHLHLQAGRYRDAVTWWEGVPANVRASPQHARRLMFAYVGVGEEHRAIDAMRTAGISEDSIATELEQARVARAARPPTQ